MSDENSSEPLAHARPPAPSLAPAREPELHVGLRLRRGEYALPASLDAPLTPGMVRFADRGAPGGKP